MKSERLFKGCLILALLAMIGLTSPVFAGSLEPPGSAVDASGNPVATTPVPPSWSKKLLAAERFELVLGDAAVLDKETGLVWDRSPSTSSMQWTQAFNNCYGRNVGDRKGWRLPTIEELASLVDSTQANPALPSGHPFDTDCTSGGCVQSTAYWSATTATGNDTYAWVVRFNTGGLGTDLKTSDLSWCVRSGPGYETRYVAPTP